MTIPNIQYVAVKALIANNKGQVLVLKQSDATITGGNKYHPPGGIVELGETLEQCVIREIYEEIGISSTAVKVFDVGEWYAERGEDVMQFIGIFYVCEITSNEFILQKSEVDEVVWIGLDDIDSIDIIEPSKSIIKKFLLSIQNDLQF